MSNNVKIIALGSGSSGNSFAIISGENVILVDAGFSRKELCCRLNSVGIAPENVRAVLVTHEHSDHVKGCRVLCNQFNIPLFLTDLTARYMQMQKSLPDIVRLFEPGSCFNIGDFEISPFSVPHDAENPVGFIIKCGDSKIGIATDLGQVTPQICAKLANCTALIFECNYDRDMLVNSDRALSLKRRILGSFGHMGNVDTMAALPNLVGSVTKLVMLVHISGECNSRELVMDLASTTLRGMQREDIQLCLAEQHQPSVTLGI